MNFCRNQFVFFCCFFLFVLEAGAQTPPPVAPKAPTPVKAVTPKPATKPAPTDPDDIAPPTSSIVAPAPARPTKLKTPEPPPVPSAKFDDVFQSLDYPELQVLPSASERLRIQASEESRVGWYNYWPVQVSSIALISTALMTSSHYENDLRDDEREDAKRNKNISLAVGASWLIGTTVISMSRPYRTGFKKVSEFPTATRADRLRRERLAEEHLQYPGEVANKLKYIAVATNFLASLSMMPYQDNSGQVIVSVSALAAFLPLIFDTTYESTWYKHLEYKKRIYVPLVGLNTSYVPVGGFFDNRVSRLDNLTFTWSF